MTGLVPEDAMRLQAMAFVKDAELSNIGRSGIIRHSAKDMAEGAIRKLLDDCVTTEGDYMGFQGQTLRLDVYVLSPQQLHKIIIDARMQGEKDAMRWGTGSIQTTESR